MIIITDPDAVEGNNPAFTPIRRSDFAKKTQSREIERLSRICPIKVNILNALS